ncbi:MAG: 5'-nucleotidase C-terminal domain-containing protein [Burkholderiales bacterium]|nr:5'-nucleotidase C-terminal domain-containing protein [Burkholderiales bacterium]
MKVLNMARLAAPLLLAGCAALPPSPPVDVKLIGFNDYHGNLQSPGSFAPNLAVPAAQRVPVGGAAHIAAHVNRLKAQNPNHVVVGAGDMIGATPLISSLFHDEPSVETLNRIGLEFNAVGNHEFDKGSAELLRLQRGGCKLDAQGRVDLNSCQGAKVGTPVPFEGAKFQWLSANVIVSATGQTLLPAYGVKRFQGVPVAFIGMTLKDTPGIVIPTGVAGLEFRDEAATVNALVPKLRAEGIEAIVVLVHEGGVQTGSLQDINECAGNLQGTPIARIVAQLDDAVDLVLSGHTHAAYNCRLPNAKGRAIPVSSANAFGRVLSDIDLKLDPATRDVLSAQVTNRLVDHGIPPDATVAGVVRGYEALVAPRAAVVIGSITTELPNNAADAACNMPAGELIADAQLAATAAPAFGGAAIALMNRGGVRTPGFTFKQRANEGDGNVTYGEAFTTQPFGNSLVTMTLTAQQLKDVLEQQFAGCRGQLPTATRLMIPSAGFKYRWNGAKACGERVHSVTLTRDGRTETLVDASGRLPEPAREYRVTVNSFMASGGDSFGTFTGGKAPLGGALDIDALVDYMARFKAPNAPYAPGKRPEDGGTPRIQRDGGTACPTGADTNP